MRTYATVEMERLRARIRALEAERNAWEQTANENGVRAEKAEAALAALKDEIESVAPNTAHSLFKRAAGRPPTYDTTQAAAKPAARTPREARDYLVSGDGTPEERDIARAVVKAALRAEAALAAYHDPRTEEEKIVGLPIVAAIRRRHAARTHSVVHPDGEICNCEGVSLEYEAPPTGSSPTPTHDAPTPTPSPEGALRSRGIKTGLASSQAVDPREAGRLPRRGRHAPESKEAC